MGRGLQQEDRKQARRVRRRKPHGNLCQDYGRQDHHCHGVVHGVCREHAHAWREVWARAWVRRPGRNINFTALNELDVARYGTVQEGFLRGGRV